jgi:hypothetical protein
VSGSARVDHHSAYGTFASPRISALFRSGGWTSRVSVGTGFFPASALTEETEAAGLSRLTVRGSLKAETGDSAPIDVTGATWRKEPLFLTAVYGFVRARECEGTAFEDVPLTPRQSVTLLGGVEDEDVGRFVVEWFYAAPRRALTGGGRSTPGRRSTGGTSTVASA